MPGIAGRSPSYIVRQLYDIQQGTRKGTWSPLMKQVVDKLTQDDMIAIARVRRLTLDRFIPVLCRASGGAWNRLTSRSRHSRRGWRQPKWTARFSFRKVTERAISSRPSDSGLDRDPSVELHLGEELKIAS